MVCHYIFLPTFLSTSWGESWAALKGIFHQDFAINRSALLIFRKCHLTLMRKGAIEVSFLNV